MVFCSIGLVTLVLCVPSVLWHCWLGHLTRKNPSPIWHICVWWDVKPYSINQSITVCSMRHLVNKHISAALRQTAESYLLLSNLTDPSFWWWVKSVDNSSLQADSAEIGRIGLIAVLIQQYSVLFSIRGHTTTDRGYKPEFSLTTVTVCVTCLRWKLICSVLCVWFSVNVQCNVPQESGARRKRHSHRPTQSGAGRRRWGTCVECNHMFGSKGDLERPDRNVLVKTNAEQIAWSE